MLDIKYIRTNPDAVISGLSHRNMDAKAIVEDILAKDKTRRDKIAEVENLKKQMNDASKQVAMLKKDGKQDEMQKAIDALQGVSASIKALDAELLDIEDKLNKIMLVIPNLLHESVPIGKDASQNVVVREVGAIKELDFTPKDHSALGEDLDIIDLKRASKLSGARFALFKGLGARLERALINFMIDTHRAKGYVEIVPPFLVTGETLTGTGQLPKFEEDLFRCKDDELYLIPTAEVPLTNIHRDEILNLQDLPIKYMAYTPCFRREAGSYGKDTRGIIRNHQFDKVELVKISRPETAYDELEGLTKDAGYILELLEIPYRVVSLCTGDTGFSSNKTYDLEVWMAGEKAWREISSCSVCSDFQARRLNMKYRDENGKPQFVYTLNGSGLAVGRTLAAVLENYQDKYGNIVVPKVLQKYMDGVEIIKKG